MKSKAVSTGGALSSWSCIVVLALLHAVSAHAQSPVLQRGYDAGVSGATLNETVLKTSNVVPGSFGLVFKLSVDDNIMAQPLYVPNVTIKGAPHNVLYVATMGDTVYAFPARVGGAPLWTVNLATAVGAVPVPMAQFAYGGIRILSATSASSAPRSSICPATRCMRWPALWRTARWCTDCTRSISRAEPCGPVPAW